MKNRLITLLLSACLFAAAAYADILGASSDVKGSVPTVKTQTQEAFRTMGIKQTGSSSQMSGSEQVLKGQKDDINVEVTLHRTSKDQTNVAVTAKQGELKWNNDFAQSLLSKIVQKG